MKKILITGASAGIGKETALFLHHLDYKVIGVGRRQIKLPFDYVQMDLGDQESIKNSIDKIYQTYGHIDILVNNAGMGVAGTVEHLPLELARSQMEINFFGPMQVIQNVLPRMRKRGAGQIINVSSLAGVMALPYQAHYSASKFAIEGLTEALRLELVNTPITVSLLRPGDIKTNFTKNRTTAKLSEADYSLEETLAIMERDEMNGPSPRVVAKKIHHIIKKRNPKLHYSVGMWHQRLGPYLKSLLGQRQFEWIMKSTYKL